MTDDEVKVSVTTAKPTSVFKTEHFYLSGTYLHISAKKVYAIEAKDNMVEVTLTLVEGSQDEMLAISRAAEDA